MSKPRNEALEQLRAKRAEKAAKESARSNSPEDAIGSSSSQATLATKRIPSTPEAKTILVPASSSPVMEGSPQGSSSKHFASSSSARLPHPSSSTHPSSSAAFSRASASTSSSNFGASAFGTDALPGRQQPRPIMPIPGSGLLSNPFAAPKQFKPSNPLTSHHSQSHGQGYRAPASQALTATTSGTSSRGGEYDSPRSSQERNLNGQAHRKRVALTASSASGMDTPKSERSDITSPGGSPNPASYIIGGGRGSAIPQRLQGGVEDLGIESSSSRSTSTPPVLDFTSGMDVDDEDVGSSPFGKGDALTRLKPRIAPLDSPGSSQRSQSYSQSYSLPPTPTAPAFSSSDPADREKLGQLLPHLAKHHIDAALAKYSTPRMGDVYNMLRAQNEEDKKATANLSITKSLANDPNSINKVYRVAESYHLTREAVDREVATNGGMGLKDFMLHLKELSDLLKSKKGRPTPTERRLAVSRGSAATASPGAIASGSGNTGNSQGIGGHSPGQVGKMKKPAAVSAIYQTNQRIQPQPQFGPKGSNPPPFAPLGNGPRPQPSGERSVNAEGKKSRKRRASSGSEANSEDYDSDDSRRGRGKKRYDEYDGMDVDETKGLEVFNTCEVSDLTGSIACTEEQAEVIVQLRPYASLDDMKKKLGKKKGVSYALFEQYIGVMQGYVDVDRCLAKCESIGSEISKVMEVWAGANAAPAAPPANGVAAIKKDAASGTATPMTSDSDTGIHVTAVDIAKLEALAEAETSGTKKRILKQFITEQPKALAPGVVLKDYQMLGLNWLNLLWTKKLSCILADDMGLGKTVQVISFLALLREQGIKGPHLIIVPSSTLENWVREFQKFAPEIDVKTYYGSQGHRKDLQHEFRDLNDEGLLEVLITTYDLAWKPDDQKFLRKRIHFNALVFDEGHTLKNYQSQRYESLIQIKPEWRLLLTGTPLQNNLQELVSILKFIREDIFDDAEDSLRQIFKVHSKGTANLLSQQRVSRARTMMTPFVLRRRKAQVLSLPPRIERVEKCPMTKLQTSLYKRALRSSKAVMADINLDEDEKPTTRKTSKAAAKEKEDTSSNILMDLRKAASHPLLFRHYYDDKKVGNMAKDCMKEPEFCTSDYKLIVEDMSVMSDAELHFFCVRYPDTCGKYALSKDEFLNVGKMQALLKILEDSAKEGKRVLLFSQLTQILDILQTALDYLDIKHTRLDGSTKVDQRQALVDEFTEDTDITVFLLSTRAGGMGINLVAASVVVIYDQDFNPHNDRQAADRAYRIGQTRPVEVIKLVSENSIDEDMFKIGETKVQLDRAVGGEGADEAQDAQTVQAVKKSLLTNLRAKMDSGEDGVDGEDVDGDVKTDK